ncbi:MAG: hypothetical protein AB2812_01720 [Candidatus Sedimenticola endophacoides]
MDLLDFETESLYFDRPMPEEAKRCLELASQHYGESDAEFALMRAYFLEPENLSVLVALYRFYYYQHRFEDTGIVAERVLILVGNQLSFPANWNQLSNPECERQAQTNMPLVSFYLLALKGSGFVDMRLGDFSQAALKFKKLKELDPLDRLRSEALLQFVETHHSLAENDNLTN